MKEAFLDDVKDHSIDIELDNGLFRSVRFKRPDSLACSFRLITWPGYLAISGDMGDYMFSRLQDMFDFFRGEELKINAGYWIEKLRSVSCSGSNGGLIKKFDPEGTAQNIEDLVSEDESYAEDLEYYDDLHEFLRAVSACSSDIEAVEVFKKAGLDSIDGYTDLFAYKLTFHTEWCLYAIRWGIQQYDTATK